MITFSSRLRMQSEWDHSVFFPSFSSTLQCSSFILFTFISFAKFIFVTHSSTRSLTHSLSRSVCVFACLFFFVIYAVLLYVCKCFGGFHFLLTYGFRQQKQPRQSLVLCARHKEKVDHKYSFFSVSIANIVLTFCWPLLTMVGATAAGYIFCGQFLFAVAFSFNCTNTCCRHRSFCNEYDTLSSSSSRSSRNDNSNTYPIEWKPILLPDVLVTWFK